MFWVKIGHIMPLNFLRKFAETERFLSFLGITVRMSREKRLMGRRQVAKTQDFDSCIRRFESSRPSQFFLKAAILKNG